MKLTFIILDDWAGMYVDEDLTHQNHTVDFDFFMALEGIQIDKIKVMKLDSKQLKRVEQDGLPKKLETLRSWSSDYDKYKGN